jgi:hypothetical protein
MPIKNDNQEIAKLRELNEELSESLERCHALLEDCRSKLGANSNDNDESDKSDGTGSGLPGD